MKKHPFLFWWFSLIWMAPLLQGGACLDSMTRDQMVKMLVEPSFETFMQEKDLEVAWQSIGGQLKLIEILLQKETNASRQDKFQMLLCQGFASYALLMEPRLARLRHAGQQAKSVEEKARMDALADHLQTRMRKLALRGRDHCFSILTRKHKDFTEAASLGKPAYTEALKQATKIDVPTLFWAGFGWGYALVNGLEDTNLTAQIPQIKQLMTRIIELDPTYFFGGAHLFLGTLFSQSDMLGGNLAEARKHFDKAYELSSRQALIIDFYEARFYAQQKSDTAGCKKLLERIKKASPAPNPQLNLMNAWSKAMSEVASLDIDKFCP